MMTKDEIIERMADVGLKSPTHSEFIFIRWDQLAKLLEHESKKEREEKNHGES